MSFSEYHWSKSPFQKKKSRKEAKEDYIAVEAESKLTENSDLLELNAAQDVASEKYKKLSRKEKRNLKKNETDK